MIPLLLRPYLPNVTTTDTIMLDPQQNSSCQTTSDLSMFSTTSSIDLRSNKYENVSTISANKSSASCVKEENESLVITNKKVPKIVLHRTHPPTFSMYRGSKLYHHRFKQHNKGDTFKLQQHSSTSINRIPFDKHCECCSKKVVKITQIEKKIKIKIVKTYFISLI